MRRIMLSVSTIAATTLATVYSGNAQNYAWCLVNDLKFGSTSCAFVSREQCMMSTGGNVGHCVANPAYTSLRDPARRSRRPDHR
jgi:Protein of unknown function (DUF3551)